MLTGKMLIAVALGGALGAVARAAVVSWMTTVFGGAWPVGTLAVNVVGSLLAGVAVETLSGHAEWPPEWRMLIVTGFLGALTTFSTFALDTVILAERGEILPAVGYVLASVVVCIAAVAAGLGLGRWLL